MSSKKINRQKIAKKLNIKIKRTSGFSQNQLMSAYGFIPGGLAWAKERHIWVNLDQHEPNRTFIHEIIHILMQHPDSIFNSHKFCLNEIECELVTDKICKEFGLDFDKDYINHWKGVAKKNRYWIIPRKNRMEQAYQKFIKATK